MSDAAPAPPARRLSTPEFVALVAMLSATIAFSIDAMLPALPAIAAELSPGAPNAAQLIVVGFVLGMGAGTLFAGPLSDAYGRKPVMLWGAAIYCLGAAAATVAPTLEGVVAARVVQGIGAAGPRVVALAVIRDLYAGRGMARIGSYVMTTFALVPAVAPLIGAGIVGATGGWRGVFWAFVAFSAATGLWLATRLPETLPPAARRPMRMAPLRAAAREVAAIANTRRSVAAQTLVFATLFATIVSVQGIYAVTFDRAESFPLWFGAVALVSGSASLLNARLVERLGMLWLIRRALAGHVALSVAMLLAWHLAPEGARFAAFVLWQVAAFALVGLTVGNLLAVSMEPLGHVAGMASSLISAVATVGATVLVVPIGLAFAGTPVPLVAGTLGFSAVALWLAAGLREGG